MDDRDPHHALTDAKARIDAAKKSHEVPEPSATANAKAVGLRAGIELLASVAFMGFIGWALDRSFETAPWLMILFFILGMAGGLRNIFRTVEHENNKNRDLPPGTT